MSREWNGSQVMGDFAKIAAESGLITTDFGKPVVGNPDKETPVKDHRRHEPGKEYGVTKETGEDLIGEAHPKDAKMADSMGEGGLVENLVQQQEKDIEVATRMPSGALVGKHAELVNALVALANELEGEGKAEAAARVDRTIERISGLPFGNSLRKEAAFFAPLLAPLLAPLVKTLLWGGLGAGAWRWFGAKLTSVREGLAEDIQDVLDVAASVGEDSSLAGLAGKLQAMLGPYVAKFQRPMPLPGDQAGLAKYNEDLEGFGKDMEQAAAIVEAMVATPEPWYKLGLGAKGRLREKFTDLQQTLKDTGGAIGALSNVAQKVSAGPQDKTPAPQAAKPANGVAEIQALLAERGMKVPQSGKLDKATRGALRQLALQLDEALRRNPKTAEILDRRGWNIPDAVLRPDGRVMDASALRRLVELAG